MSLDDFGTGHSTLTLLHDCPIDEIKLDRSFTQAPGGERMPVAAAVLHLAQVLGLHAVAEGVETAEQLVLLTELGCTEVQGFLLARPMRAADLVKYLNHAARQTTPASPWLAAHPSAAVASNARAKARPVASAGDRR